MNIKKGVNMLTKASNVQVVRLVRLVHQAGLGLMIGGMVETRPAMGFSAHMAAGLGIFR
jgi:hypothetical protein